jgi:hypothetical protein
MRWFVALVALAVPAIGASGLVHALAYRKPVRLPELHEPLERPLFILSEAYVRRECAASLGPRRPERSAGTGSRLCDCVAVHVLQARRFDELRTLPRSQPVFRQRLAEAAADCGGVLLPTPPERPPRPVPPLQSHLSADYYPASSLRNREQGRVRLALRVGPGGRVATAGSGPA